MAQNPVLWTPSEALSKTSQMKRLQARLEAALGRAKPFADFEEFCDASIRKKDVFWKLVLEDCVASHEGAADPVFVAGRDFADARWFPGLRLNYAENLVAGMCPEGPVLVGLTERPGLRREWTKAQALAAIAALQAKLIANG